MQEKHLFRTQDDWQSLIWFYRDNYRHIEICHLSNQEPTSYPCIASIVELKGDFKFLLVNYIYPSDFVKN